MRPWSMYTTPSALTVNASSIVTTRPARACRGPVSGSMGPSFFGAASTGPREGVTGPVRGNHVRGGVIGAPPSAR